MKLTTDLLRQLADEALPTDAGLFVLDARVSESPVRPKARVVLDGDDGVGIDECARVSRAINRRLEELLGEEAGYVLEVTSPGADAPLALPRQYPRHVGRTLAVTLLDGTSLQGELQAAGPASITLQPETPKRVKGQPVPAKPGPQDIAFADIRSAVVVISFK